MTKKINYSELSWNKLMAIAVDTNDENRKTIMNVLLTIANELDNVDEIPLIVVEMLEKNYFPEIVNFKPSSY